MWLPGEITREMTDERDALLARWRKEQAAPLKVLNDYLSFCRINKLVIEDEESTLALFASWRTSARAPTSNTPIRHLRSMLGEWKRRGEASLITPSLSRLVSMAAVDASRHRRKHAVDIPIEVIAAALVKAPCSRLRAFFTFRSQVFGDATSLSF